MVTIRELAAFVGMTNAAKQAIPIAPLFHRYIQAPINRVVAQAEQRGETTIPKNGSPLTGSPGRTFVVGQDCQDIQFYPINTTTSKSSNQDRCILVWLGCQVPGAPYRRPLVSGGTEDAYQCSRTPSSFSGNQDLFQGEGLSKYSDPDRQYDCQGIHKPLRGHHSQTLNSIATQLWKWCLDHQVHLTAEYLPGVKNKIAYEESRVIKDLWNWMIHPQVFDQINTRWGPLEVDMFASRLTHQVLKFFSWGLDPAAEAVNAFNQDWSQFVGYANPPWCLILSVLAKIRRDRAKVILVAPVWSTQPWYPLILQILYNVPCLLPKRDDLVISPSQREFIMPTGVPQLATWPLSGNSASQEAFQQMLLGCSQHPGETRSPHLMNPSSKSGTAGVWKGAEIPLGVL